jgi:hypothetical protein
MDNHLTAAIVTNDPAFGNKVLGATINGTTYLGIRARCTMPVFRQDIILLEDGWDALIPHASS